MAKRYLLLKFEIDEGHDNLTESEIHDMGERIVTGLVTGEPVTYDGTEVINTGTPPPAKQVFCPQCEQIVLLVGNRPRRIESHTYPDGRYCYGTACPEHLIEKYRAKEAEGR